MNGVESNLVANNSLSVGVLNPPNALHKPTLYSDKVADRQFRQLAHDLYEKENSEKFENKRKTPLSVMLTLAAGAIGAGYLVFKKAMKW